MTEWLRSTLLISLGALGVAAFYEIEQTVIGRHIGFGGSWGESPRSELYFWLATTFLLLPGAALIAWGVVRVAPVPQTVFDHFDKHWRRWAGGAGLAGTAVFAVLNRLVFHSFPFTDDEWGARFGGELLANGALTTEAPGWMPVAPDLFLYLHDGQVTSFDWLGAMVPWAIGELTGLEGIVFSVAAGATLTCVMWFAGVKWGGKWALGAGVLFIASPMALSLSATTHTHVWSRAWVAAALCAWLVADLRQSNRWWLVAGFCAGFAWITRPLEVTALLGPLVVMRAIALFRHRDTDGLPGFGVFLTAGATLVVLFIAHDFAVTGSWLPARLAGNNELSFAGAEHYSAPLSILGDWELLRTRFGANLSYNLMMLGVYGLSLPGLFLAAIGIRDRLTGGLALGLAACFALALLHDDYGLHIVGPIHYADAFIPFLLLVVSGMHRIVEAGRGPGLPAGRWAVAAVISLAIWGTVFSSEHLRAIERQGRIHDQVYSLVDAHPDSIVLADPYHEVWRALPDRGTGTYVYGWRRDLGTEGRALIVEWSPRDRAAYETLFTEFPDRKVLRLRVSAETSEVEMVPFPKAPRGM
jgi:hypothetical protein